MMKWLLLGLTLGLFAVGCGGSEDELNADQSNIGWGSGGWQLDCIFDEDCPSGQFCEKPRPSAYYGTCQWNRWNGAGSDSGGAGGDGAGGGSSGGGSSGGGAGGGGVGGNF